MNLSHFSCTGAATIAALVICAGAATAQTGYNITGGLSNFDVTNRCDHECDEFEIEIEDIRPEDVVHTYRNGNYGSPTVTLSPSGTSTIIDYRHPAHTTTVNTIEHFGVSLRQLSSLNAIRVRWMRNGLPATVNGQVPIPGGGTAQATQPVMPSISADMAIVGAQDGIALSVINNDLTQPIWIRRRAQVTTGLISLESLMRNDPVVTTTVQIDANLVYLAPGQTVTIVTDLVEVEDDQSVVFAAEYHQDIFSGGPFGSSHVAGPSLGNVMTATIAGPEGTCDFYAPVVLVQPISQTVPAGTTVNLRVNAEANDMTITYQWLKEGQPLVESDMFHAVDTDELSIEEVTTDSEGFYQVRISNACGEVVSDSALVFVTGHNEPPVHPAVCVADFNSVNGVSVQDLYDFLSDWNSQASGGAVIINSADINNGDGVTVQDLYDFLSEWNDGCE